jgi:hypothetical protein
MIGFLVATVLEISAVTVWTDLAVRRWWLPAISLFHVFTWAVMNIFFWENLLLMWAILPIVNTTDERDELRSGYVVPAA